MAKAKKSNTISLEEKLEQALVLVDEQPYEVPENWKWVKLDGLVSIVTGKKDANYGSEKGEYTFFTCAGEPIRCDGYSFEGESLLLPGNGANVGQVFYYKGKFEAYQRTYVLQPLSDNVNLKYLYYQIQGFWEEYNKDKQYGSATNYIKMGNFVNYNVPVAPLAEQQRIVEQIESLFVKLDEAKAKLQEAIDGVDSRKASILDKAFKGELTLNWRNNNEVSDETWSEKTVGELFAVFSGKGFKEQEYSAGGVKLLRISNVTYNALIWDDTKYLPKAYLEEVPELVLRAGDIVMALNRPITNGKLKVSMVDDNEKYILYQRVGCLRKVNEEDDIKYLQYALQSKKFLLQVENNLQGSDQPYINIPPLKSLRVDVCSPREQREIVTILNQLIPLENEAKNKAEMALEQIDLMKKSILAKAFRGELGTNNPNEESAIELLKQIIMEDET